MLHKRVSTRTIRSVTTVTPVMATQDSISCLNHRHQALQQHHKSSNHNQPKFHQWQSARNWREFNLQIHQSTSRQSICQTAFPDHPSLPTRKTSKLQIGINYLNNPSHRTPLTLQIKTHSHYNLAI